MQIQDSSQKKKGLFIGSLPPPVHGSSIVNLQIKNSKQINESFHCDWVNLSTSRTLAEIGKRNPIKLLRFAGSFFRALWFLITQRYDFCYLAITCHGAGFLKDSPFVLLCKLFRRKIIIHQHNKGMSKDVDRWPYRWLLPLCYKNVKVILLSWHLYKDIEKVVPKENVMICPNGIKVIKETQMPQKEETNTNRTNITNKVPKLLFLSNLIESKGVIVLLDALRILADMGNSFQCIFVGGETKEIDAKRFTEEVDKRQLNRFVVYRGRKYGAEKNTIFADADIFVFPTFYNNECFPLVLLEALQHSLPCVTTSEGGITDIIEDGVNGLICERQNPQSLADSIARLLMNPGLRKQMGDNGRKKLGEKYTEGVFENRIKEILLMSR